MWKYQVKWSINKVKIPDVPTHVMRIHTYQAFHIIPLPLASAAFLPFIMHQSGFPSPPEPNPVISAQIVNVYCSKFSSWETSVLLIYSTRNSPGHYATYDVSLSSECDIICIVFAASLCHFIGSIVAVCLFDSQ